MADRTHGKPRAASGVAVVDPENLAGDESERALGRMVALGLPVAGLFGAVVVGVVAGLGSALLVVAAATLLGTIALFWASLRTLSGDAPLALDLEALGARRHGVDALAEDKRRVLRALKDLESEHAVGKIDPKDYQNLVARYRDEAKSVMREMDLHVAPLRAEAEKLARSYLKKRGLGPAVAPAVEVSDDLPAYASPEGGEDGEGRRGCAKCKTSNEPDAAFCKKCGAAMRATEGGSDAKG